MTAYTTELHQNNLIAAKAICKYVHDAFGKTTSSMQQIVALDVFRLILQASPEQMAQYVNSSADLQQVFTQVKWSNSHEMVRHGLRMRRQRPKLLNEVRTYLNDSQPDLKWLGLVEPA
ncbi:MAG: hypothetical protein KIH69_022615 [Anaerolineae bacterium]|nr:hypothetical protein [Anaerolineae bacterium]